MTKMGFLPLPLGLAAALAHVPVPVPVPVPELAPEAEAAPETETETEAVHRSGPADAGTSGPEAVHRSGPADAGTEAVHRSGPADAGTEAVHRSGPADAGTEAVHRSGPADAGTEAVHRSGPADAGTEAVHRSGPADAGTEAVHRSGPADAGTSGPEPVAAAAPPPQKKNPPAPPPRGNPPLILAVGPMLGPHAFGTEECRSEEARCERAGTFFGLGLSLELRARLFRILYAHVRPWVVGNVGPGDRIYRGAAGAGVGLGVYGQHIFGRGEYIPLGVFGSNRFEPPFYEGQEGRDEWGNHAGMVTVGFRGNLKKVAGGRMGFELWVGPMFGPTSTRTISGQERERRTLITFMLGVNLSFDVVPDRNAKSRGRTPRKK